MEMRRGYKQTEVGIIPEDWQCTTVGQLVREGVIEKPLDGNHGNIHPKSGDFVSFGIPFVMANNIQGGRVDLSNCAFIRREQADSLRKGFSRKGDVLLTHKATIGNTAIVGDIPFDYIMLTPQVTYYRVADRKQLSNTFLRQFFDGAFFQSKLFAKSGGGTRAYIGITAQLELPVILPPTTVEQEAIADVLSDADDLIESLEQLVAKKRQIKQGAMQELLNGKRRLPGFEVKRGYKQTEVGVIPEDWASEYIENLADITTGSKNTQDRTDDGQYPFFVRSQKVERINTYSFDGEAVLTAGDGVGTGKIFHYVIGRFDVHQRVYRISGFNDCVSGYFFYLNFSSRFYDRIMQLTAKSSVDSVRREMIARMLIPLPPTKTEQEAIASILRDMDAEIAALEAKLAKARQIKQGMMQELLTGRIRLV
jgi:type I restriction enzyme S subunit